MIKRGILYYYSGSGNTERASLYLADRSQKVEFELCDIVKGPYRSFDHYDVVGFACYSDAWNVPHKMKEFIAGLPRAQGKTAFVMNTFGCISGRTLLILRKLVTRKGFKVVCGHSLHCPENYPPMIVGGHGFEESPDEQERASFDRFIIQLGELAGDNPPRSKGCIPVRMRDRLLLSCVAKLFGLISGTHFMVDQTLCVVCRRCVEVCPYGAIEMNPRAVIDSKRCYACWGCYNHCPVQAIYTRNIKGNGQYGAPNDHLRKMLSLS